MSFEISTPRLYHEPLLLWIEVKVIVLSKEDINLGWILDDVLQSSRRDNRHDTFRCKRV